ncbi:MAG: hypothetical protein GXZ09_10380 [Syntrophomonadaceae bacterium]|jgi:hypothetical protein|nr:hypothetical protein [Syntrophomonadaceae bacterium]
MDIISLDEFNQLPHKDQVAVHRELKNTIGINGILEAWNLSRNKYYYMVKKRNLNEDNKKKNRPPKKTVAAAAGDQNGQQKVEQSKTKQINPDNEKIAFDISIQGSTKVISSILESITETYDSDRVFQVNMSVRQI